ncbi:argininosuccinate synthetase, partial [Cryomyces antarcticus]
DFEAAKQKALKIGASKCYVEDLRQQFVELMCFPAIQANAIYENVYLLGTSLARPILAKSMMQTAQKEGCQYVSHGCTGKGNDQVRFELAFYALQPSIQVIAPWRGKSFLSRDVAATANLAQKASLGVWMRTSHCSYEAGILEDPDTTPPEDMWKLTVDPMKAPDTPEDFTLFFKAGLPVKLVYSEKGSQKTVEDPLELFLAANAIARRNGVGRIDIVENRFIGLKSRGCYETPGLSCLRSAHIDLEGLVLDREVRALRDQLVTFNYAEILYNGLYFSPEREYLEDCIVASQKSVNVRCRCYKGSFSVLGRSSETEKLYDASESSMDEIGDFAPSDTTGFISVQAIRLKKYGKKMEEMGQSLVKN